MKTYSHPTTEHSVPRPHPWTHAQSNPAERYYDLKKEPQRIRTSLEDFVALGNNVATDAFYDLLEWLNGPNSLLESNDCGTRPVRRNRTQNVAKRLECTARLMVLFRKLPDNLRDTSTTWLEQAAQRYLLRVDSDFEWGVVGTTLVPAQYVSLSLAEQDQMGKQLLLSFWAWGDDEAEVLSNLGRSFANTRQALVEVSNEARTSAAGV